MKSEYEKTYSSLHEYNQQINKFKSAFSQMEIRTGINIPNVYEK